MNKSPTPISKFSVVLKSALPYLTHSEDNYQLFRESAIKEKVPKEEYDKMWEKAEILGKYDISLDKDIKNTILMLYYVEMGSNDIMRTATQSSYYYLVSLLDESEADMQRQRRNKKAFCAREFLLECKNWIRRDLYNIYCSVLGNTLKKRRKVWETSHNEINEDSNSTDLNQLEESHTTPPISPAPIQIPITPLYVSTPIQNIHSMMTSLIQPIQKPTPINPHTSTEPTFHNMMSMSTKQRKPKQRSPSQTHPQLHQSRNPKGR